MKKFSLSIIISLFICTITRSQDSTVINYVDTTELRIIDLNPYFTLHVDSTLNYQLQINKESSHYFWYLKNAPVGLRINKENGTVSFKAEKSFFNSGRLKYDVNYNVVVGVQNLNNATEKTENAFTIVFYNTEVIASKVKAGIGNTVTIEEGQLISFKVFCENGSFPIENIITVTSVSLEDFMMVQQCGDEFKWRPSFDFVKESDGGREKQVLLQFIGATKFGAKDTSTIRVVVKDALNYPLTVIEHNQVSQNVRKYVLQLKYTFLQLDKKLKKTKTFRTGFDLTSATTSLTGTIMATSASQEAQRTGKILPSVGLALVPIKEASVPNKMVDQNQASLIRTSIKRLEYMLQDNQLIGDRDSDILKKMSKLKDELKQVQVQLIDVPIELTNEFTEEELNRYFNSPKVNKKYRLKTTL